MSVADSLAQAKSAHLTYRDAIRRGDQPAAKDALRLAQAARLQAAADDPTKSDGAWFSALSGSATQADLHDELLRFYAEQLSR